MRQRRHPHGRCAPRAGRRDDGARLCAAAHEARGLHGGLRAGGDQPCHRPLQRARRLHAGGRSRRLFAGRPVRQGRLPGDRPDADHGGLREVVGPRLRSAPHPGNRRYRLPAGDGRQAGAGLYRYAGRRALHQGAGGRDQLDDLRAPAAQEPPRRPAGPDRGDRRDPGRLRAPGDGLRLRHSLVGSLGGDAPLRRCLRHSLLHHAAGPGRRARGPSLALRHHALDRLPRSRLHPDPRHAAQLHRRPCRAAALQRRCAHRAD